VKSPKTAGWFAAETIVVGLVGLVEAAAYRFAMNPDGVSYLNLSDYYREGNYSAAANGYWSPLYPWILGKINGLLQPEINMEAAAAHAVNVVLFFFCYFSWRFFFDEVAATAREKLVAEEREAAGQIEASVRLVAFSLFLWCCFDNIGVVLVTPDLLVAGISFLAAGLLQHIYRVIPSVKLVAGLGLVLAAGYLAKAVMFPAALLFMVVAINRLLRVRGRYRLTAALTLSFAAISAPQVIATSKAVGKLTYAETGPLSYAMMVNGYGYLLPEKLAGENRPAIHPVKKIHSKPDAFVFPFDVSHSSYPLWDDPAYWANGIEISIDRNTQLNETIGIAKFYLRMTWPLLVALVLLAFGGGLKLRAPLWPASIVGVGMILAYALVYAEERHVAPWLVLIFLPATIASSQNSIRMRRPIAKYILMVLSVVLLAGSAKRAYLDISKLIQSSRNSQNPNATAATALTGLGLSRGARIGYVGNSFYAYWARLAGAQIAMEVPDDQSSLYWTADPTIRMQIDEAFMRHGAEFIVGAPPKACAYYAGWTTVTGTGLCLLRPQRLIEN
jgi:hypothetical protein